MSHALEDVIIDLLMHGADRGALVRPAQGGKPTAVCVILASNEAIAAIGGELRDVFRELGSTHLTRFCREVTEKTALDTLFENNDEAPCGWSYALFRLGCTEVMVVIVAREVERVAAICNAHGAPCSLDANRAAPGYEIERRITR